MIKSKEWNDKHFNIESKRNECLIKRECVQYKREDEWQRDRLQMECAEMHIICKLMPEKLHPIQIYYILCANNSTLSAHERTCRRFLHFVRFSRESMLINEVNKAKPSMICFSSNVKNVTVCISILHPHHILTNLSKLRCFRTLYSDFIPN